MVKSNDHVKHRGQATAYHIRLATQGDHEAIGEINRRAWSGGITTHELLERRHGLVDGRSWTEHITDAVADSLRRPDVTTFVAEREGQVVGYATAQIKREGLISDVGIVGYNAVHPNYRGRGIGTALCERVMSYLKEEEARVLAVWTLEVDEPARRIYERLGFKELTRFVYYSMDYEEQT